MAQLDGKQLKNQSISLDKLKGHNGLVTFTASATMSFATGSSLTQATGNINNDLDVVNKKYVDDAVSVINADFITGVTAGNGLSGGGTSGFITLDLSLGVDSGLTFSGDNLVVDLNIAGNGLDFTNGVLSVTTSQITSDLAGNGLTANGGNLDVNVNADSLEIVNDVIRLKDTVTGDRTFQNNFTVGGDLFVQGSFSVSGSSSTINTVTLVVSDPIIALGNSQSGSPILDEGLMFVRGTGLTQAFIWDESDDTFALVGTNDDHTVIGNVNIVSYSNLRLGGLTTSNIKITDGAQQDYVLVSDSSGFASWTSSILNAGTGLTKSGTLVSLDYEVITGTGLTQNGTQISIDTVSYATSIAGEGLSAVGGTLSVNVGNGLSIQSDNIYLGGTLSQNTTIEAAGNDITINSVDNFSLTASTDIQLRIPGTFDHILNITPTDAQLYSGDVSTFSFVQTSENQVWLNVEQSGLASGIKITNTPSTLGGLDNSGGNYMLIKDQQASKGLVYEDDYTANFTTYSLVTKGYVDSAVANVGAGNGLQELSPGVVGLGGTLSQNTTISGSSYDLTIQDFDTLTLTGSVVDVQLNNGLFLVDAGNGGSIDLYGGDVTIIATGSVDITTTNEFTVSTGTGSITTSNLEGLVYTADYSATFVNNSLITKKYVDDAVSVINADFITGVTAGNGLSGGGTSGFITLDVNTANGLQIIGDDVALGGTLSQDTTINLSGKDLTISGTTSTSNFTTNLELKQNALLGMAGPSEFARFSANVSATGIASAEMLVDFGTYGNGIQVDESNLKLQSMDTNGLNKNYIILESASMSNPDGSFNNFMRIVDDISQKGLVYDNDYSANWSNNSLITKAYVDSAVNALNNDAITGVTAGAGLSGGGTSGFVTLDVNLGINSGLTFSGDDIIVDTNIAGNGLDFSNGVLTVNTTEITSDLAGNGLTANGSALDVNVNSDSLEIISDVIRLKDTITGNRTFQDSVIITGDLTVNGTTSYIQTENLYVEDNVITLNATWSGSPVLNAGIEVNRGTDPYASLIWNESTDLWSAGVSGSEVSILLNTGNGLVKDGATVSLDYTTITGTGLTQNGAVISIDTNGFASVLAGDGLSANGGTLSVNVSNGLSISSDNVELGGTLNKNTIIEADGFDLTIQDFDILTLTGSVVDVQLDNGLFLVDAGIGGAIDLYGGDVTIFATGSVDITTTNEFTVSTGTGSITTSNLQGLVYTSDYSSTFVNNSLVSKQYVDDTLSNNLILGVTAGQGLSGGGTFGDISLAVELSPVSGLTFSGSGETDTLEVSVDGSTIQINGSGQLTVVAGASQPVYDTTVAVVTSGTGSVVTGTLLSQTPNNYSRIEVFVNGQRQRLDGTTLKDCYFSNDGGLSAISLNSLVSGDQLYWNGGFAGFELSINDIIEIVYEF